MSRLLLCVLLVMSATVAVGQTPACDELGGEQRELASELLSTLHPYDCCDETIAECLKERPVCALAWRLAENLCRKIARKESKAAITRGLFRRARSMMPSGDGAAIDLSGTPVIGPANAPVSVVEYACARCPFCARITPALYRAIRDGSLSGMTRLYFKVFPIRNHEYSKEAGLGFMAAGQLGSFWEFMLYSYERFDAFCVSRQVDWAEAVGMDRTAFEELVTSPATRERLVASKKEGIVNEVQATPTFFINGRKFFGEMTPEEMIDVLEEEYERVTGVRYRQ